MSAAAVSPEARVDAARDEGALERRVAALECRARAVQSNESEDRWSLAMRRVADALRARGVLGAVLYRVPRDYYDRPLAARAALLGCGEAHLCKSILMENTACSHSECRGPFDSRYVLVILQYLARLDGAKLARALVRAWSAHTGAAPGTPAPRLLESANFVVAPEGVSDRVTGFLHNAVTPFGMAIDDPSDASLAPFRSLPIVIAEPITALRPPLNFIWLGGGEVDVKLRLYVPQLLRALDATRPLESGPRVSVLHCTTPRDRDDDEDDA